MEGADGETPVWPDGFFARDGENRNSHHMCHLNLQLSPSVSVPFSSVVSSVGSGGASVWGRGLLSKNHSVNFIFKI